MWNRCCINGRGNKVTVRAASAGRRCTRGVLHADTVCRRHRQQARRHANYVDLRMAMRTMRTGRLNAVARMVPDEAGGSRILYLGERPRAAPRPRGRRRADRTIVVEATAFGKRTGVASCSHAGHELDPRALGLPGRAMFRHRARRGTCEPGTSIGSVSWRPTAISARATAAPCRSIWSNIGSAAPRSATPPDLSPSTSRQIPRSGVPMRRPAHPARSFRRLRPRAAPPRRGGLRHRRCASSPAIRACVPRPRRRRPTLAPWRGPEPQRRCRRRLGRERPPYREAERAGGAVAQRHESRRHTYEPLVRLQRTGPPSPASDRQANRGVRRSTDRR